MNDRYFVDKRSGIIAVRDRVYTNPDYNGLHNDTGGVIISRMGYRVGNHWELDQDDIDYMNDYCNKLNTGEITIGTIGVNEGNVYICNCGGKVKWDYGRNLFDYNGTCDSCSRAYREGDMYVD